MLAAVVPQGEAEAFAGTAQPGGDQLRVVMAQQTGVLLAHQIQPHHRVEADPQLVLVGFGGQAEGFLQLADLQAFVSGELVEQIGDRELHRHRGAGYGLGSGVAAGWGEAGNRAQRGLFEQGPAGAVSGLGAMALGAADRPELTRL